LKRWKFGSQRGLGRKTECSEDAGIVGRKADEHGRTGEGTTRKGGKAKRVLKRGCIVCDRENVMSANNAPPPHPKKKKKKKKHKKNASKVGAARKWGGWGWWKHGI